LLPFFRDFGAITGVRTQGECGACWAVTAVETVEAAHFLATGTLYELSESEIIACDDSCQMCDGKVVVLNEFLQDDCICHWLMICFAPMTLRWLATKCLRVGDDVRGPAASAKLSL
jgi:hypothetical protein